MNQVQNNRSTLKKVLIPLVVLGLVVAAIAYYMYNKPVESLEKKKAEISVSAAELLTAYETDEDSANDKYLGKVVEVSGRVTDVTNEDGKNKIHLDTGNPISAVICELEDGKDMAGVKAGVEAKVKGLCSGYLSDVILVQSTVVKM